MRLQLHETLSFTYSYITIQIIEPEPEPQANGETTPMETTESEKPATEEKPAEVRLSYLVVLCNFHLRLISWLWAWASYHIWTYLD